MKILTTVHGCEDYGLAIVDLDVKRIAAFRVAFIEAKRSKGLKDLTDMRFGDGGARYFAAHADSETTQEQQELIATAYDESFAIIPDGLDFENGLVYEAREARTECDFLVLDDRFVFWTGGLSNSPEQLETPLIAIDDLVDAEKHAAKKTKTTKPKAAKAKPKRRTA